MRNWKRDFRHIEKFVNNVSPNGIKLNDEFVRKRIPSKY